MSEAKERPASVRRYVFFDEHRPSRAWMPTLETINERFSQQLRAAMVQELKPGIVVTPPGVIQLIRHGELIDRLAAPSHLTLARLKALRGTILFAADAELVGWIVESRFGGSGRFPVAPRNREFTLFEQKTMRHVAAIILEQFALAWKPIAALEPEILRHESNPQLAGIANAAETIIVSAFDVKLAGGGGKLTVAIPYVALEPLHERLMSGIVERPFDQDQRWREALQRGVGQAAITLNVELAVIAMTVRELLSLRPGDVFEIERPNSVTVEASGLPLFLGRWGRNGRKIAVRIEERLPPAIEPRAVVEAGQERG
ncbi:MAG TPA: FliM/FliN family flagellar motor switch protein [Stellaceae bacterium]|nr:FliM/FliN family flagellar motor switch protein [Stellaceae bacterium]